MVRIPLTFAALIITCAAGMNAQWEQLPAKGTHKCLAICAIGNSLVAATHDSNLYRSTDQGQTWSYSSQGIQDSLITYTLYSQGNAIYLGSDKGGYVSDDEGQSWRKLNIGSPGPRNIYAFLRSGSYLFLAGDSGVYRSSDSGLSWQVSNTGIPNGTIARAFAFDGKYLYVGTARKAVLRSNDNGEHWTSVGIHAPAWTIGSLWAGHSYVVAMEQYGGWMRVSDPDSSWELHPGSFVSVGGASAAYYTLYDPDLIICGSDYGVIRSRDYGKKWELFPIDAECHVVALCVMDGYLYAATPEAWIWRRPLSDILPPASINGTVLPYAIRLSQSVPNPAVSSATVSYALPSYTPVIMKVYNAMMQEVATVVDEPQEAGEHTVTVDASTLSNGIYYYRLSTGTSSLTRRMVVVR